MKTIDLIKRYKPCNDAVEWLKDKTVEEAFEQCKRPDWMLWLWAVSQTDRTVGRGLYRDTVLAVAELYRSEWVPSMIISVNNVIEDSIFQYGKLSIIRERIHDITISKAVKSSNRIAFKDPDKTLVVYNMTVSRHHARQIKIIKEMLPIEVWKF